MAFDYSSLFYKYYTAEGIPFTLKNRSIAFPEDKTNPIYRIRYIAENTPWTILSYLIYRSIDKWWVLCSLNQNQVFYAEEGSEIRYILPEYIDDVIATIQQQANS